MKVIMTRLLQKCMETTRFQNKFISSFAQELKWNKWIPCMRQRKRRLRIWRKWAWPLELPPAPCIYFHFFAPHFTGSWEFIQSTRGFLCIECGEQLWYELRTLSVRMATPGVWNRGPFLAAAMLMTSLNIHWLCLNRNRLNQQYLFDRFPFRKDSTIICVLISFIEFASAVPCIMIIITAISFFFGVIMYTEAILNDIKSMFNRIDREPHSKKNTVQLKMTKYTIEAIDLHVRLIQYEIAFYLFIWKIHLKRLFHLQMHGTVDRYHELHHFYRRGAWNYYRRLIDFHVSDGNFDPWNSFQNDLELLFSVAALWLSIIFRFTIAIAFDFFWYGNAFNILLFRTHLAYPFNEPRRHGLCIGMVSVPAQQSNRHITHDTANSSTIFHHRVRLDEMRFGQFHRSKWEIFFFY